MHAPGGKGRIGLAGDLPSFSSGKRYYAPGTCSNPALSPEGGERGRCRTNFIRPPSRILLKFFIARQFRNL